MTYEIIMRCNRPAIRRTPRGRSLDDNPAPGRLRTMLAFAEEAVKARGEAEHRASKKYVVALRGKKFAEPKKRKKIEVTLADLQALAKESAERGTSLSELSQYYDFMLKLERAEVAPSHKSI